ncbi:MAG: SdpI family protein [Dehalococcoidia bacterium]
MNVPWAAIVRREWPHWVILAGLFAVSAFAWNRVTLPIPTHWNAQGEIDGYGGRFAGLLLVPLIAVGMYALLALVPRIDPARANYASFTGPYSVIRGALTATMGAVHGLVVATALGYPIDAGRWIPVGVGVLLIVIGNVLGKVRPNFFVGVRTPWTLTSARSWEKTHRAGGRLFVIGGIGLALTSLAGQPWLVTALGVCGGIALVWLVYYSYAEWKVDPDRVSAVGTRPAPKDG